MDEQREKELLQLIKWQQKEIERLTEVIGKMAVSIRVAASSSENNFNIYK